MESLAETPTQPTRDRQFYKDAYTKTRAELKEADKKHQAALRLKAEECQKHMDELSGSRETARQLQKICDEVTTLPGKVKKLEQALKAAKAESRASRLAHRERVRVLEERCQCCRKTHISLMESLVDDAGLSPVLAAARKVEALNTAIADVAFFLGKNVQTMVHEIFQEEIERSYENCERTIGSVLAPFIYARTQQGSTATPDCLIVNVVAHIFILSFCVSRLNNCSIVDAVGETIAHKSWEEIIMNPPPRQDVKSMLLHGISDIFKVASWAILGTDNRDAFQAALDPLFSALEALNATGNILSGANIAITAVQANRPFISGATMHSEFEFEDNVPQYVAGAMSFGLQKRLPIAARAADNAGASQFKPLISGEVILYSTLEKNSGLEPPNVYEAYPEISAEDVEMGNTQAGSNPDPHVPSIKMKVEDSV